MKEFLENMCYEIEVALLDAMYLIGANPGDFAQFGRRVINIGGNEEYYYKDKLLLTVSNITVSEDNVLRQSVTRHFF